MNTFPNDRPMGYAWLVKKFGLETMPLTHESYIGTRAIAGVGHWGGVSEAFQPNYWPGDTPFDHMVFALKYDDLNLDVLRQVFGQLGAAVMADHVASQPNSKYARLLGYLFEMLTGTDLSLSVQIGGTYVEVLDPAHYLVAKHPVRNSRWRISDNLLGSARFCPIVRRSKALDHLLAVDFTATLTAFRDRIDPAIFRRAVDYLYFKETRSSYDIEKEKPTADREQRFVRALRDAGKEPLSNTLAEAFLTEMQNLIVEPRYAATGYRTWQNYVGESMPDRPPRIHYVCPPGEMVSDLMTGLLECAVKTIGLHPVVRAALLSFGFVYVHPFEDGNGRLHRFLIHDVLGRDGLVPDEMILPVSAYMLHHPQEYERTLEAFSKPLRTVVRFTVDDEESLTIVNPDAASGVYRYPDLTTQTNYLLHAVEQTISTELVSEILFIRGYDAARLAIRSQLDIPDRRLDLLIRLLYQNKGSLPKSRRSSFAEVTDDELERIEAAYQDAFASQSI